MTYFLPTSPRSIIPTASNQHRSALAIRLFRYIQMIWTSAVIDEAAIRFNLRLLAILTSLLSLPDIGQALVMLIHMHTTAMGQTAYWAYVAILGLSELSGGLLLIRKLPVGRLLILGSACGFYLEMILGLGGFERNLLVAGIFVVCAWAEAWVIWFLRHPRVRAAMRRG